MLRKSLIITTTFLALTLPAAAQFPPPGIYACSDHKGADFGTLTLLVAGDYDFASEVIPRGQGQLASSGPSVSDVLAEPDAMGDVMLLKGVRYNRVFLVLSPKQHTVFVFRSRKASSPVAQAKLKGATITFTTSPETANLCYMAIDSTRSKRCFNFRLEADTTMARWQTACEQLSNVTVQTASAPPSSP